MSHLKSILPGSNPYWQFESILNGEAERGIRSAFYFLNEQRLFVDRPVRDWFDLEGWRLYAGRYSLEDERIIDLIERIAAGGWEIGLHGSYESYRDRNRLQWEKARLEHVVGEEILGGRQHYLNLDIPATWRWHSDIGLQYDTSLGSSEKFGFHYGYGINQPFDDDFIQFPLTLMEIALPDVSADIEAAWGEIDNLLIEAAENDAIMTVLWHPRYFNETEFPGYAQLYWRLIDAALDRGAWVGPPGDLYNRLNYP